ncbi:molybdopterin oxidoreductase [Betaproteobacteria bacterium SCN2]|jgi:molybdopterin-containing oxidoreductase family membrane subunit|nr:molybdopterin oxidoreductase [Betaproteobacteria bacterium SCN2]
MQIINREIEGNSAGYWALLGGLGALILIGLFAAYNMEHHGHVITGMNNQIVWGLPHVFAVFLVVAASGALNVASVAGVFGKKAYKPLAPLSALLAIALLAGGLAVLMLDLGRADRAIITAWEVNPTSVFSWNVVLYSGFFGFTAAYLWTMLDKTAKPFYGFAAYGAFIWRLILTTGTGLIFGFLVARQAFGTALLAPKFIVFSLLYGTAIYVLVLMPAYIWGQRALGDEVLRRLKNMLVVFIAASFYMTLVYHLTNVYFAKQWDFERFILQDGGIYTILFWLGQVVIGYLVPFILLVAPNTRNSRSMLMASAVMIVLGALAQMYVTIVGGQAFPLEMFPGFIEKSSFFDGEIHAYTPSHWEWMLGIGGTAIALAMVVFAVKVLRILPESLADDVVDPHAKK